MPRNWDRCPHCKRAYSEEYIKARKEKWSILGKAKADRRKAMGIKNGREIQVDVTKIYFLKDTNPDWSSAKIAKEIGCSRVTVSNWLRKRIPVDGAEAY